MKKLIVGSMLIASVGSFGAFADELTGYISDAHCGAAHDKVSAKNTACIKKCLSSGSDPVLVHEGKVLKFDAANKDMAKAHAGEMVTVNGTVSGDTVNATSIEPAAAK
ncbi:MAG TPA: hypothetical protein VLJ11_14585 [Bryobacteraceae bacterium]|nr:hypothetical protein [Bryobacteraceae bacterium]